MNIILDNTSLNGTVRLPVSKSLLHRQIIAAGLSGAKGMKALDGIGPDILCDDTRATLEAVREIVKYIRSENASFGSGISRTEGTPAMQDHDRQTALGMHLFCRDSGTTLRLLLPVIGALGIECDIYMSEQLAARPMEELARVLSNHGMCIEHRSAVEPSSAMQTEVLQHISMSGQQVPQHISMSGQPVGSGGEPYGHLHVSGQLSPGTYEIRGDISSQYISGLLMALPLLEGDSRLHIHGPIGSRPYIDMTLDVLRKSGVTVVEEKSEKTENEQNERPTRKFNQELTYHIDSCTCYSLYEIRTEPDWSAAAFWKVAQAIDPDSVIDMPDLEHTTLQGDSSAEKLITYITKTYEHSGGGPADNPNGDSNGGTDGGPYDDSNGGPNDNSHDMPLDRPCPERVINLDATPDLAPALAVAACAQKGRTVFTGIERLIYKESNRCKSICDMINALGGAAQLTGPVICAASDETAPGFITGCPVPDESAPGISVCPPASDEPVSRLIIDGTGSLKGGTVDPVSDHRIAMAAAVAALICENPVTILHAECVSKSYPAFLDDFRRLQSGGL